MTWFEQHKHRVLVSILCCAFLLESTTHGLLAARIFISVIFFAVLFVVFEHRHHRIVAIILAIAGVASGWAHYSLPKGDLDVPLGVTHYLLATVFFGYSTVVILGNIFRKGAVSADDVLGAVCGYLVAGAAWSNLYALIYTLVPDAFALSSVFSAQASDWPGRTSAFNYFSIVTLTTMGYGDITPVRAPATGFAMLEAVFGQFYIAIVVAQLVGARMSPQAPQNSADV